MATPWKESDAKYQLPGAYLLYTSLKKSQKLSQKSIRNFSKFLANPKPEATNHIQATGNPQPGPYHPTITTLPKPSKTGHFSSPGFKFHYPRTAWIQPKHNTRTTHSLIASRAASIFFVIQCPPRSTSSPPAAPSSSRPAGQNLEASP